MKKSLLVVLLVVAMVLGLTACGNGGGDKPAEEKHEVVLITDAKSVDDKGFNQYSWEGVLLYAQETGVSHTYYMPTEQTTEQYLAQIATAVKGGAKVIVCPGFLFGDAVAEAQNTYPDVTFICIDFTPADCQKNAIGVLFEEEESGFLAGYAAVKEGFRSLGFAGAMAVPAVKNFGYGYLAGAEYAAKELGLEAGSISCIYDYTGEFAEKPQYVTQYQSWYTDGVEVVFGCGSPRNVFQACDTFNVNAENKAWAIGVDTDCSDQSQYVITSAMKNLSPVVYALIKEVYAGTFEGAREVYYNAADDAVCLPTGASWKFANWTEAEYNTFFAEFVANKEFRESLPTAGQYATAKEFADTLTYVTVNVLTKD